MRLRPTSSLFAPVAGGMLAVIVASGPMLMVNVPLAAAPPVEVYGTAKVASPCEPTARVSTGSTVKEHPLPEELRVTVILLASTPVASAQLTV